MWWAPQVYSARHIDFVQAIRRRKVRSFFVWTLQFGSHACRDGHQIGAKVGVPKTDAGHGWGPCFVPLARVEACKLPRGKHSHEEIIGWRRGPCIGRRCWVFFLIRYGKIRWWWKVLSFVWWVRTTIWEWKDMMAGKFFNLFSLIFFSDSFFSQNFFLSSFLMWK